MSESLVNKLNRNQYLNDADIAFLLTELQGFREKTSDIVESTNFIPFADETRLRGESHTVLQHLTGTTPKLETRTRQCTRIDTTMIRKISPVPKSYPLIHSIVGTALTYVKPAESRYGSGGIFDGATRLVIDNHARLNITDEITFGGSFYLKSSATIQSFLRKTGSFILRQNNDVFQAYVYISGVAGTPATFSASGLLDTWVDLWVTWKSPNLKLYVNGILRSTITRSGAITPLTNNFTIGGLDSGGEFVVNGHKTAWVSILNKEVLSSWITDRNNGILDTNGLNEITTIPFTGNEKPQPESTFGITAF